MGTRGAIGFRIDNADKIAYNQFDSYPTGVGANILQELCGIKDWENVKARIRKIVLVTDDQPPTQEQINANQKWADLSVSERSFEDWYCLLRKAQGTLAPYIDGSLPIIYDAHTFLLDSLFCEYAYIVNLDNMTFEFYRGFNRESSEAGGRYAVQKKPPAPNGYVNEYFGVVLVETIPLSDFPTTKRGKRFIIETTDRWNDLTNDEDEETA